jgi:YhcH/YjgK/YiaL family protein
MIFDSLDKLPFYLQHLPSLQTVMDVLDKVDLLGSSPGFHYTDNPLVRYNIIDYTSVDVRNPLEIHRREADVQIVLIGEELAVSAPRSEAANAGPYDKQKDVAFFNCDTTMQMALRPGLFALFFPGEPHRGNIVLKQPTVCRKVVFKLTMGAD